MNNNINNILEKESQKILNEIKKLLGIETFENFKFLYQNFGMAPEVISLSLDLKKAFNKKDRNLRSKYFMLLAADINKIYNDYLTVLQPNRNMEAFLTLFLLNQLMCDYIKNKEKLNLISQKRYNDSFIDGRINIEKLRNSQNKYWELLDSEIDIKKLKSLKNRLIKVDKKYESEYDRLISLVPKNEKYEFKKEDFDISFGTDIENQFYDCINWLQNTIIRMIKYNNSLVIVTNEIFKKSIEASDIIKVNLLKEFSLEKGLFCNINKETLSLEELKELNEKKEEFSSLYKEEFETIINMLKKAILVKTSIPYLAIDNKKLYPGSYKKDLTHLKQTITRIINLMERCLNLIYTGEDVA